MQAMSKLWSRRITSYVIYDFKAGGTWLRTAAFFHERYSLEGDGSQAPPTNARDFAKLQNISKDQRRISSTSSVF